MIRPTRRVGQQASLWLLFALRIKKCFRLRYLLITLIILILLTYLRLINHAPVDPSMLNDASSDHRQQKSSLDKLRSLKCNFDEIESLLRYKSTRPPHTDSRPRPTIERLRKLFQMLISYEDKFRRVFDHLQIFRFTDMYNTLRPYANDTQRLHNIYCLLQRYTTISDNGHIDIESGFINYLSQVSSYLADGFDNQHLSWNTTSTDAIRKPVIVLGSNIHFFNMLQASMRTIDKFLKDHNVAVYDLGFTADQVDMITANCKRCTVIKFPFEEVASVASHVRNLANFAWKPIIIHDAVRRFGSIIYGDTSVRYNTSNFTRLLIDNEIRGFSCRELPGHYLPCFTLEKTFTWFNETPSTFDDVYIAEAGFVAVTDNFLSRLVLKTWVTCALDPECIAPTQSKSVCKHRSGTGNVHRYDQSAMVAVLSFYFFPSSRNGSTSNPAPYDMYASIQGKLAEVRRGEGDPTYFTVHKP
ncbi:unnamed protein product [Adineta ricciae]|uniref:Uncharacterized protein n=2 Tax=Adineta ricciae TaxID=249248 RepID=A0A815B8Y6_ADIRI|nr:unnamed protein product [Adineta ricciae]